MVTVQYKDLNCTKKLFIYFMVVFRIKLILLNRLEVKDCPGRNTIMIWEDN